MMVEKKEGLTCAQGCWALAIGAGFIGAALLIVIGEWRLIQAIFSFVVLTIILGALLQWLVCRPMAAPGEPPLRDRSENPVPSSKESAAAAATAARAVPAPATPAAAAASAAKAEVKPSKALAGEAELASRKGAWKYETGAAAPTASVSETAAPAKAAPATPAATEPAAAGPEAAAPAPAADAPEQLSAAREGGPDDLKMIKGVGPKLEQMLHSLGFFHFDQVASWNAKEVAWVDQNLEGFKGRVSRDNWVEQAKILAAGGSTDFSQRAKKGDVH